MQNLLITRHAIALDPIEAADAHISDAQRPLTDKGISKMQAAAKGIRNIQPDMELIISSPYLRAMHTAQILHQAYDNKPELTESSRLEPGMDYSATWRWLAQFNSRNTVAIVGHQPDLSEFAAWILTGKSTALFHLKKAAACMISVTPESEPGDAELMWLLMPKQLRALGVGGEKNALSL